MAFQTPITIRDALGCIEDRKYALPAIQREFVWPPEKICALFDSLMRGYPIGSFLFWHVQEEYCREFKFYDFMREYHERTNRHCDPLEITQPRSLTAVLDGQQRLTAFNIAFRGSMATKVPRKRRNNPNAYPKKRLHLNLLGEAGENEANLKYDFRFLTEDAARERTSNQLWFPVPDVMQLKNTSTAINRFLIREGISDNETAFELLAGLYDLLNRDATVVYFLEKEQDLDKVLNIFIRVNSGATPLSYSDLLMSIATASWKDLDARDAIHNLVDDLNETRDGFALSKDFVLKAGLMLTDISSVGFKVTNFNAQNMATLEDNWDRISSALHLTVRLAAQFGFSEHTLSADSALLPIAYSLYQRRLSDSYLASVQHKEDREAIRGWLTRSLLKSGVWGSGLDTTLTAIRSVLGKHGESRFPVEEIEAEMARRGRGLQFSDEEIEDLTEVSYGDRRCFPLLSILFPFVNLRDEFHIDHVFPRSRVTRRELKKLGVDSVDADVMQEQRDLLPNLQLLPGAMNQSKGSEMPAAWLDREFTRPGEKDAYCEQHALGAIPDSLSDFELFYSNRRERLNQLIRTALGSSKSTVEV